MKKKVSKLRLDRETLHVLASAEPKKLLDAVGGGTYYTNCMSNCDVCYAF